MARGAVWLRPLLCAPHPIRSNWRTWEPREIALPQRFDIEARTAKRSSDRPRQVATARHALPDRLYPILPLSDIRVGCAAVLEKKKLSARLQDPAHLLHHLCRVFDRAERESAHNRIEAAVGKGNILSCSLLDVGTQPLRASAFACGIKQPAMRIDP